MFRAAKAKDEIILTQVKKIQETKKSSSQLQKAYLKKWKKAVKGENT